MPATSAPNSRSTSATVIVGVLDDVVDEAARHRGRIQLQVGEDLRHLHAVRDVRLPGVPHLARVGLGAESVGVGQEIAVQPVMGRDLAVGPAGDHLAQRGGGHSSPASAKLV